MFSLDEQAKCYLLAQLTAGTTVHFLLDRYWNQLIVYLLVAPLQWLHIANMMNYTDWNGYNLALKITMMMYVVVCLTVWEGVRIFLFHTFRAVAQGEIQELALRLASVAQDVGQEGFVRAKPHIDKLQQSVVHLASKAKDSVLKLVSGTPN